MVLVEVPHNRLVTHLARTSIGALTTQQATCEPLLEGYLTKLPDDLCRWIDARPPAERDAWDRFARESAGPLRGWLASARSHTQALVQLLAAPPAEDAFSLVTLARVVVESSALFCYVTDAAVPPPARLLRMACAQLSGYLDQAKLAKRMEAPGGDEAMDERAREVKRILQQLGVERHVKGRRVEYRFEGHVAPLDPTITPLTERYLVNAVGAYAFGSASVHSAWVFVKQTRRRVSEDASEMTQHYETRHLLGSALLTLDAWWAMVLACWGEQHPEVPPLGEQTVGLMELLYALNVILEESLGLGGSDPVL